MLAAKAGAKHVYAIEASGLAVKARENIVKNGFKDQITYVPFLKSCAMDWLRLGC